LIKKGDKFLCAAYNRYYICKIIRIIGKNVTLEWTTEEGANNAWTVGEIKERIENGKWTRLSPVTEAFYED